MGRKKIIKERMVLLLNLCWGIMSKLGCSTIATNNILSSSFYSIFYYSIQSAEETYSSEPLFKSTISIYQIFIKMQFERTKNPVIQTTKSFN